MTPEPRTLSVSEEVRIFLGLLVQPFVAAGLTFVAYPLMDRSGRAIYGGIDPDPMRSAIALALYVGFAAFFVTILAAFPAAVWVLKRYPLTLRRTLLWGVLLCNILSVLGTIVTGPGYGFAGFVRVVLFASFLGLGGATAFWAIWMLSRPRQTRSGIGPRKG